MAGFRSPWASIPFVAFSVAIVFLLSPAAHSAALIRCPDWQRYVTPTAALRSTRPIGPKQSFEAALAANRTKESRPAATKTRAGQGAAKTTAQTPNRSASARATTESAAAKTTGPLDAAGIFSRKGRKTKKQAIPCPTHTVVAGDTLGKIAKARLGSAKRWPELAKANALTSPSLLRIGQRLQLPCAPDGQRPGHRPKHALRPRAGSTPRVPASTPVAPLPVWTARPGEFVTDVITRWAKRAGHTVVRDGVEEWKLSVPVKISGSFKDALDQLVVGFEGSGRPLAISVYANKVIRIGRPL